MKGRESGRKTGGILADVSLSFLTPPFVASLSDSLSIDALRTWDSERPSKLSLGSSKGNLPRLTRRLGTEVELCESSRSFPVRVR